jgi:hypothetical protein
MNILTKKVSNGVKKSVEVILALETSSIVYALCTLPLSKYINRK